MATEPIDPPKHGEHPQSPTAKWKAYQAEIGEHVRRAAARRAQRDREQADSTVYHRHPSPKEES